VRVYPPLEGVTGEMGIFGYAPLGQEWQMNVKNARVFEEKLK
jgi:hypothetical protein